MAVKIAPSPRQQFEDANGNPYVGAKLFTYASGSTTKLPTYTDSGGGTANTNPIILDSAGRTPFGLWLTEGKTYKFVLALSTDADPPSSPIFTEDVVSGVNDTSTATSQWQASGSTPTYVSATTFTVPGDKTADFHVGRRLKFTVTAGTVYGLISVTAYTTLTTVTVIMDSTSLDSGLSAVDHSMLTRTTSALPVTTYIHTLLDDVDAATAQTTLGVSAFVKTLLDDADAATARTTLGAAASAGYTSTGSVTMSGASVINANSSIEAHATAMNPWSLGNYVTATGVAVTFTGMATAPQAGAEVEIFMNAAHIFTDGAVFEVDGDANYTATAGDRVLLRAKSTTVFTVHPRKADGTSVASASQAEMEAASSTTKSVTPGRVKFSPNAAKAWAMFNGTTAGTNAPTVGVNVTSVTRTGAGDYTINFTTAFSSANYAAICLAGVNGTNNGVFAHVATDLAAPTASALRINVVDQADVLADSSMVSVIVFGDF